ncbi:hypothetical protein FRB94_005611 [Tulasnella sp. JGI-2019a]|nr:hypothetical protein FRB93_006321 [Tulasnella sp. JGI-2019a]KAG9000215.1 hypothetical protein FRB94_005611 [Tulasnella sp. JGI-2019a]KAG9028586.1 hypothetical protein FRB95_006306 [Tulasnella sp. JGI-2019a]
MSQNGNTMVAAARAGDIVTLQKLIGEGVNVDERSEDGLTALMAAAVAANAAVDFLLSKKADINARDSDSRTIIKLTLDAGHKDLAQSFVDRFPDLIITDPRLPKGADWLRDQFAKVSANIQDDASKPRPALLDRLLSLELGPVEGRDVSDVYWEHIFLRYIGDIPLDIQRNYSETLVLSLVGTFNVILHGHAGIRKSGQLLNGELPTTQYDIVGTVIMPAGSWVTERWGYYDVVNVRQVVDGIDTFLIEGGKIKVKMINYNVEKHVDSREDYEKKVGLRSG